jgi:tetratricopeptide (TPR) repeat protein
VLKRFKGKNPFFDYYLGYIYHKNNNSAQALQYFKSAAAQPVDDIFPYRLGTVEVLKTALQYNPADGNAYYYMGNILYEKQPDVAMKHWESAVQHNPGLSVAYRNLGWGYNYHLKDIPKSIAQYEKAIALNKNEALYYTELSELYEKNNAPIETRMKIFEGSNGAANKRDDSYQWYIENLILAGQASQAVELLEGVNFAYREGSSRSRNIKINANLLLGKQYYDQKAYQKALDSFLKAQVTREEAGNDRLGDREAQVDYFIGLAYEALNNRSKATASYRKSVQNLQPRPSANTAQEQRRNANQNATVNVMSYYQALSYDKLGNKDLAKKLFDSLIAEADNQLQQAATSEVGMIFGGREAMNDRLSRLYTMRGLGYKGLGESSKAKEDLKKALELSRSNLWVKVEGE